MTSPTAGGHSTHARLRRAAQLLPLIAMAAWVVTLALPVLDSGDAAGPRIMVTSLGGQPFNLTETHPAFLLAWIGVLGCAASVWLLRSLRWWSVATMLVALMLGVLLLTTLVDPPSLLWDGVDEQGRPTGGYVIGQPAAGAVAWALGIGALFAAGLCAFVTRTRQT